MTNAPPLWIAQRHNQDWTDEDVLGAIAWLTSSVDSQSWSRRMDIARQNFETGKNGWAVGNDVRLYDPEDKIAWYCFQAHAYASGREDWYEPDAFRIVPIFKRLGQILPDLKAIGGIEDRVATLLTKGKSQPDDGFYELLVAGAYKRRNWTDVKFVPEQPGIAKTQDIYVSNGRRRWAVECKRAGRSGYEATENELANDLIVPVHRLCRLRQKSVTLKVIFKQELSALEGDYLLEKVEVFLDDPFIGFWEDECGVGEIRYVDWSLMRKVLAHDVIFFGSSRMAELLTGQYLNWMDYNVAADWVPASGRPLFATEVTQASVVSWASHSPEAVLRKASHFKSIVARASKQLPTDIPGVVHVGYEAKGANSVDDFRHILNAVEIRDFDPDRTRMRWIYGNYLSPEHTNNRNEAWAISETTAPYKVGRHGTAQPLPSHLLFSDGPGQLGHHW